MKETGRYEAVVDGHTGILSFGYDAARKEVWVNIQDIEAGTQIEARLDSSAAHKLYKENGFSSACIECFHDVMYSFSKRLHGRKDSEE